MDDATKLVSFVLIGIGVIAFFIIVASLTRLKPASKGKYDSGKDKEISKETTNPASETYELHDVGYHEQISNETTNLASETATEQENAGRKGEGYGFTALTAFAGIVLLIVGLTTDAGSDAGVTPFGNIVNLHKLHIKQTLYYFSGICFIMSSFSFGVQKIVRAMRDIQIQVAPKENNNGNTHRKALRRIHLQTPSVSPKPHWEWSIADVSNRFLQQWRVDFVRIYGRPSIRFLSRPICSFLISGTIAGSRLAPDPNAAKAH